MIDLVPIAHAGHWLLNVAYLAPVLGFLGWLLLTTWRERRGQREGGEKERERPDSNRRPPA
jgi:hypothetical protein